MRDGAGGPGDAGEAGDAAAADGPAAAAAALLAWYDQAARNLPWRTPPGAVRAGVRPDPYAVWLSEVMLQQTTVAAVVPRFRAFRERWPDVLALARAAEDEVMAAWAGLGYYARARSLIACAREVADRHGGRFPEDEAALRSLPGVGRYTAAAIAAIAFGRRAVVVDGNVRRVVARLFGVAEPLPAAGPRLEALARALTGPVRPGDHAQAMMDLGATLCTPRRPACAACPLAPFCIARASPEAAALPRRRPRPPRPGRVGLVYVARRADGAVLLERRPTAGLLGGMPGFPTSAWSAGAPPAPAPPLAADWRRAGAPVDHVFTHFRLRLWLLAAEVGPGAVPDRGAFVAAPAFDPAALPALMRKVWAAAGGLLAPLPGPASPAASARPEERCDLGRGGGEAPGRVDREKAASLEPVPGPGGREADLVAKPAVAEAGGQRGEHGRLRRPGQEGIPEQDDPDRPAPVEVGDEGGQAGIVGLHLP